MKYKICQEKPIIGHNLLGKILLLFLFIGVTNIGYSQEGEKKKKLKPIFSVFITGSFIVDSGELGTVASPLVSGGAESYFGIPKIYLYTSVLYTHSLVIQDIYNYGSALNVKFGLGGSVYSNYTPSKDKWWSLAMNGGGLFALTVQKSNVFDSTFNPQKHRIFVHFGAFVNLRAFYHFHKDVALMFGYDLTWYVYPELKSFENGFTIGLAF